MRNKNSLLIIGFIISWIYSTILFYPQPVQAGWVGTFLSVFIYGFSWIIPIVIVLLKFSKAESKFRKLFSNKYFNIGLIILLVVVQIISWKFKFSNDLIFTIFWILTILLWLDVYINLTSKKTYKTDCKIK